MATIDARPGAHFLADRIRDIDDFPEPGVVSKDITPLLADPVAFAFTVGALVEAYAADGVDLVLGVEARGFICAAPVAHTIGAGFVPVRKAGKLPHEIEGESYELEYGADLLEIHRDAIDPGQRVLVIDDVLATGGTAAATARLVERLGGIVVGIGVTVELGFRGGRAQLGAHPLTALLTYH